MLCCGGVSMELSLPRAHSSLLGKVTALNPQNSCLHLLHRLLPPHGVVPLAPRSKNNTTSCIAGRGAGLPPRLYFIVKNNTQQKRNYFPCIKRCLTKRFKNSILNPFLKNSYTYFHSQFSWFYFVCQAPETGNSLSHLKQT